MTEICGAKIRPFPNDTELHCGLGAPDHIDEKTEHMAVLHDYAYPGSATEVRWLDSDRRTFRGDWAPCNDALCPLPLGHHGEHAA